MISKVIGVFNELWNPWKGGGGGTKWTQCMSAFVETRIQL